MSNKTATCGLVLDFAIPQSLSETQRWVLSTMQTHGQDLITMLWRILGNEQDVCDAYQDTFLKLAHYQGGQKPEHIKAYVFRSANNIAISILRHKITERHTSQELASAGNTKSQATELNAGFLKDALRLRNRRAA